MVGHAYDVPRLARQSRRNLRFEEKTGRSGPAVLNRILRRGCVLEELERDVLPEGPVVCDPYLAAGAAPEETDELVLFRDDLTHVNPHAGCSDIVAPAEAIPQVP